MREVNFLGSTTMIERSSGSSSVAGDPSTARESPLPVEPDGTLRSPGAPDESVIDTSALSPEQLVECLCADQLKRWRSGQRVPAEAYLARHAALEADLGEGAFELIYGEFLLREELRESPSVEEFLWRFPRFAARLQRQLDLHGALGDEDTSLETVQGGAPALSDAAGGAALFAGARSCAPGFELLGELGRGGMGAVYKAWQVALKRVVALKVIRADAYADAQAADRFHAEAEAAARFQHPNIVQIFEVGEHEGMGYLVLEFVAGGGLDRRLAGAPQDPGESARLIETLARAMHYAHQRGIVHRDLKPANVLLTEEGTPKITDFGLAKLLERDCGLTQAGDILGTPSYMAPEQLNATLQQITPATDVYALGAVLYEMLTGRPPFKGTTPLSTMEQVRTHEPLSPAKLQRHTPRDLETICLKCLEKEPRRRYKSALELALDLRRFLDGKPILARPTAAWERAWKWGRRHPSSTALLIALALLLCVGLGGGLYYNALLRKAARDAKAAELRSDANALAAIEQRNLALKVLNQLVYDVQEKLGQTPATRPIRQGVLDTALAGLDEMARTTVGSPTDLSQAVAHQKLGDIFRIVGRAMEARRRYERAEGLASRLFGESPRDPAVLEALYWTHMGLGLLDVDAEKPGRARLQLQSAVAMSESLTEIDPSRAGTRRELIEAYFQLGRSHSFARDLDRARTCFRKMQDLAGKWVSAEPANHEAKDLLASSYRKLADLRKFARDFAAARQYYFQAIEIGRELLRAEPDNLGFKKNLAIALDDVAGVFLSQRQFPESRQFYREAERLFGERVDSDRDNLEAQLLLLATQFNIARLECDENRLEQAAIMFRAVYERLLALQRDGRLEGRRSTFTNMRNVKGEIAFCEAAPRAVKDFDFARSQPAALASRLLLLRARTSPGEQELCRVSQLAEAMCQLNADDPDDLYDVARSLVLLIAELDSGRWPSLTLREKQGIRQVCADRALGLLTRAVDRGFHDVARLESHELESLHHLPGYQALLARQKASQIE